jgi:hypothetical protein
MICRNCHSAWNTTRFSLTAASSSIRKWASPSTVPPFRSEQIFRSQPIGSATKCGYPILQILIATTPLTTSPSCLPREGGETSTRAGWGWVIHCVYP